MRTFFSEENIWKLCEFVRDNCPEELSNCHAVFISNPLKKVPVWYQRAARQLNGPVVWDYHVVLLYKSVNSDGKRTALIYDFDTTLDFPHDFSKYVQLSFGKQQRLKESDRQQFRVISAADYLERFASDRSHMLVNGKWQAEPPAYPPIVAKNGETHNLPDFISMDLKIGVGKVYSNVADFVAFVSL